MQIQAETVDGIGHHPQRRTAGHLDAPGGLAGSQFLDVVEDSPKVAVETATGEHHDGHDGDDEQDQRGRDHRDPPTPGRRQRRRSCDSELEQFFHHARFTGPPACANRRPDGCA